MSLYSAVDPQLDERLSRLVPCRSHSPHGFTVPIDQTEGMGIWRNRVHSEEMCSSGKGTCRTKGHLWFSPASPTHLLPACVWTSSPPRWVFAQRKCHLLEYLLLQLSKRGCRRGAQFVAAVSVQACTSSRDHSLLWLEGLMQISSMILFAGRAPSATHVITSHLLSSSAAAIIRPSCVVLTAYFHWRPTTCRRACMLLRCSGSH